MLLSSVRTSVLFASSTRKHKMIAITLTVLLFALVRCEETHEMPSYDISQMGLTKYWDEPTSLGQTSPNAEYTSPSFTQNYPETQPEQLYETSQQHQGSYHNVFAQQMPTESFNYDRMPRFTLLGQHQGLFSSQPIRYRTMLIVRKTTSDD